MSDNIETLTEEWLLYLQNSEEEKAVEFYCQRITPALIPLLRNRFTAVHGRDGHYDGLISLLGFTPETVVIACQFVQPRTLVLLHTKETAHLLETVMRHSQVPLASFFHEPFEEEPSRDIYVALEKALQRFPPDSRVAIELTGGKKTMGGALAVAAGILDTDLLYIDYTDYMPSYRKPKPSSTYIHLVENPMMVSVDLFGGIEVRRALAFFNIGKLEVAEELLMEAATRMGNPRVAEFCAGLARFYSSWNSFNFSGAVESGKELFVRALRFHQEVVSKVSFDLHRLQLQLETIAS
jgi:CRISPR associated protein Csm6